MYVCFMPNKDNVMLCTIMPCNLKVNVIRTKGYTLLTLKGAYCLCCFVLFKLFC